VQQASAISTARDLMSAPGPLFTFLIALYKDLPRHNINILNIIHVDAVRPAFFLGKSTRKNINFKKYVITRFCSCENTLDLADLQTTLDWS
jgi:hypothetical protein